MLIVPGAGGRQGPSDYSGMYLNTGDAYARLDAKPGRSVHRTQSSRKKGMRVDPSLIRNRGREEREAEGKQMKCLISNMAGQVCGRARFTSQPLALATHPLLAPSSVPAPFPFPAHRLLSLASSPPPHAWAVTAASVPYSNRGHDPQLLQCPASPVLI